MNRLFLAFLALLGLAAQAAPVEARACGVGSAAVGTCLSSRVEATRGEVRAEVRALPLALPDRAPPGMAIAEFRAFGLIVPTVLIGPDRARE